MELLCCCWKIYTIRGRFANLVERFGHIHWRFSDTHGEMMSLKTYAKYIQNVEGKLEGIKKKTLEFVKKTSVSGMISFSC